MPGSKVLCAGCMCTGTTAFRGVSVVQIHGAQAALHKMLPLMFSREQGMLLAATYVKLTLLAVVQSRCPEPVTCFSCYVGCLHIIRTAFSLYWPLVEHADTISSRQTCLLHTQPSGSLAAVHEACSSVSYRNVPAILRARAMEGCHLSALLIYKLSP